MPPAAQAPIAGAYPTSPACFPGLSLQARPKSMSAKRRFQLAPIRSSIRHSDYRTNPWCASFIRSVDGGAIDAAINWHQQLLRMLLVLRRARTCASGIFFAHVRAVLESPVVLMSGEMIDFRR